MQVAVLKLAIAVTCISSKTFHEVQQNISIKKGRMMVIPNVVDSIFSYQPKVFNSEKPIILHIGVGPNKNLARSVMALQTVNCKLRIVGKVSGSDIELLQSHKIDYSIVYDLSNDEIVQEYQNADIINFPSYYEGFGMPIIEGQAIGRLVITSDIEPMKTVAGNGAILCNPYDVESIRSAYLKAINDSNNREDIIKAGMENVENYRLEYITEKYVSLYKSL
jgi:glycosyltransferase involved in cell wall biosynthesis